MKVAFRADASLQMGSGHVMRCLTLADALKTQGAQCHFISREHPGHLLELIGQRGHAVTALPARQLSLGTENDSVPQLAHAGWLGCDGATDARQTGAILARLQPDWLITDHYALDQRWEQAVAPHCGKLLVIDDLADRPHLCDLLLDQNLGRQPGDYAGLVPSACEVLIGPQYALLRPEFAALRPFSLKRRQAQPALRQLLITMGGVDQPNATGQVLEALKTCALPADCRITVVMGLTAPWLSNVRELAGQMPWPTEVLVNISDMAQRMADSDLAIGAAGSTSWERCCLGLPTLMVVLADNQKEAAAYLEEVGAAKFLVLDSQLQRQIYVHLECLVSDSKQLSQMAINASEITDGHGVERIVAAIANNQHNRN